MNKIIYILGLLLLLCISVGSVSAVYVGENATGWTELYEGNIIGAAFTMYDTAFAGWTIVILFIIYQFMLILKTRNLVLGLIMGAIFAGLYVTSLIPLVEPVSVPIIFTILVLELAGILYYVFWK